MPSWLVFLAFVPLAGPAVVPLAGPAAVPLARTAALPLARPVAVLPARPLAVPIGRPDARDVDLPRPAADLRPAVATRTSPAPVEAAGTATAADPSVQSGDLSPPTAPAARSHGWTWPVPEPHQVRGTFDPPEVQWGAGHRGVDLAVAVGGVVRSPADGVVTFVGVIAGQEIIVVGHADGLRSTFQPVLASVSVGTHVAKGDAVGVVTGSPGHCAPMSCVHWGVLRGSVYLDPLALLRQQVVLLPLH